MIRKTEIDNETIYLKNSAFGWRVIHPIKKDIDKPFTKNNINWFNLLTGGSWLNLVIVAVIVIITLGILYEYTTNVQRLIDCFKDPIELEKCRELFSPPFTIKNNVTINFSIHNMTPP